MGATDDERTGGVAPHEVREVWENGLQPVPARLVNSRLSPLTRAYLTTIGLPTSGPLGICFFHDEKLSNPVSWMGRDYLPIGELSNFPIAIEPASDAVYTLVDDRAVFINSDVGLFVLFLGVFEKEIQPLDAVTGMATEAFVDMVTQAMEGIRGRMQNRDPTAIQDNGWWNSMFDEMIEQAGW